MLYEVITKPWSSEEKFMLALALHLFNENNKLPNLSDMDLLDSVNKEIALKAIIYRYTM